MFNSRVRIISVYQGKLRLGLAEPTIIVALASAAVLSPAVGSGRQPPHEAERKSVCTAAAESLKVMKWNFLCIHAPQAVLKSQKNAAPRPPYHSNLVTKLFCPCYWATRQTRSTVFVPFSPVRPMIVDFIKYYLPSTVRSIAWLDSPFSSMEQAFLSNPC